MTIQRHERKFWREAGVPPDTLRAVLARAQAVGSPAPDPRRPSDVFASGFWLEWVRCVFHAEREGLVELGQTGSEGRVAMRLTELGRELLERGRWQRD